ncbi:sigma-70 family RNA polymerase sigma factor [Hymenobacter tibetensis]|uniref:Sigma-70 family RNA polymerase sigma factor n=1 Tax=Hymenobacter tibetensis TaxID=497967 RepID=A0ABY4CY54_9BACT|nr:sigma-70 family RNA polymerase sigma factor [Hymenobacter tibetensis]UOG75198.1 sigma-70 family RNA polymerase sigma factor [Hymenobacter tibetensis]
MAPLTASYPVEQALVDKELSQRALRDIALIEAALAGNSRGYEELLGSYRKSVTYLVLKMVGNSDDAEDLTQEIFTKAFRKLAHYRPDFAFSTWLFRIATNHTIDFIRRGKLQTQSLHTALTDESSKRFSLDVRDPNLNPQEVYIQQQRMQIIKQGVQSLPPKYAKPLSLRYFQELTYEEMATELKLPIGTVKAQLFRGRQMLRAVFKNSRALI